MKRAALLLAMALAAGAQAPEAAGTAAVRRLGAEDLAERRDAYGELKKMRRRAVPALEAGLRSEDPEVAAACAELLALLRAAAIQVEGGPVAHGTGWWKARETVVSVDFREAPLEEVFLAFEDDVGYRVRLQPAGSAASRRITLRLDRAPLEFLVGWLLWTAMDTQANGSPRFGWGHRELWLWYQQTGAPDKLTVEMSRDDALSGLSDDDVRAAAGFLEAIARSEDAAPPTSALRESGLRFTANALAQAEAGRLLGELRRMAAGRGTLGREIDEEAKAAVRTKLKVDWWPAGIDEIAAELRDRAGVRVAMDVRVTRWTEFQGRVRLQDEEPVRAILDRLAQNMSMGRVEQRWGGWWLMTDMNPQWNREFWLFPVADFVRDMMLSDGSWGPGALETWLRAHFDASTGAPAPTKVAASYFHDSRAFALHGSRAAEELMRAVLDARVRETVIRRAALAGEEQPEGPAEDAASVEAKILARLGRDRVTKDQASAGFQDSQVFQEVFSAMHSALNVQSTSGSWPSAGAAKSVRACRLHDVSPRILWHWLNRTGVPFFIHYFPERRHVSYGVGQNRPWDGSAAPCWFGRSRLHPDHLGSFQAILQAWDPAAAKEFVRLPAITGTRAGGPIALPLTPAERLHARLLSPGRVEDQGSPAALEALDRVIEWPGGTMTLEEALFKLSELGVFSFILDVPRESGTTRKFETDPKKEKVRDVLDRFARAAAVGWSVGDEAVVWVTGRSGGAWVFLEESLELGAEEFAAVAKEFAKSGDTLLCYAPTGRLAANCAPERAASAPEAFRRARKAARDAASPGADALAEQAAAGQDLPPGFEGALALERASAESPAARFALARRLAAGGHAMSALKLFHRIVADPSTDAATLARARGRIARLEATFGTSDPQRDATAERFARQVEVDPAAPPESLSDALHARAEALRRAADLEGARACYARLKELDLDSEESRNWRSRIEGIVRTK